MTQVPGDQGEVVLERGRGDPDIAWADIRAVVAQIRAQSTVAHRRGAIDDQHVDRVEPASKGWLMPGQMGSAVKALVDFTHRDHADRDLTGPQLGEEGRRGGATAQEVDDSVAIKQETHREMAAVAEWPRSAEMSSSNWSASASSHVPATAWKATSSSAERGPRSPKRWAISSGITTAISSPACSSRRGRPWSRTSSATVVIDVASSTSVGIHSISPERGRFVSPLTMAASPSRRRGGVKRE